MSRMTECATSKCFICDSELDNKMAVAEVKQRGIETFRQASIKRNDGKHIFLNKKTSVKVHDKCRRRYPKMTAISADFKKTQKITQERRSTVPYFNFKTHCFLCRLEIASTFKHRLVYCVRKLGVRDTVLRLAKNRGDTYAKSIIQLVESVPDLVAAEAQYHNNCMKKLFNHTKFETSKRRGPFFDEIENSMQKIYAYLENNDEECQFSLDELLKQIKHDFHPEIKTIKARLLAKYGEDIIFSSIKKKKTIVCFKNTGKQILTDNWYNQKCTSEQEEKQRIVQTAAEIICEDIRSQVYNITDYPPPDHFMEASEAVVPATLKIFLEGVIRNKKRGNYQKWKNRCISIAHSIIAATRPKSFLSNLQVGLAVFLYKKFGSRKLVEVLSSLGFCSSYLEAARFEVSAVMKPANKIISKGYSQFVFDNADFNTQTVDGHNTFHVMGGIHCVTPHSAVNPDETIPRITKIPTSQVVGCFGAVPLKHFETTKNSDGLNAIKIKDLSDFYPSSERITLSTSDLLWLYGKCQNLESIAGWNGFMEEATADIAFEKTRVTCLPFINAPPSDYDTIYTALLTAAEKCNAVGQKTCLVTFDQPLYMKARYIVANSADARLINVIPRLGGFHLLMSFLGSIGYIMEGSGLKDLFSTIYAENSIEKIMTGHAYHRAVRANILAHASLVNIAMNMMNLTQDLRDDLEKILLTCDRSVIVTADEQECVKELKSKVEHQLLQLQMRGPTAKLWVQYIEMVTLVKQFIESERMSNWDLHLKTIWKIIPYFHASGHFAYAKCSHLYLQDMLNLKQLMRFEEYDKFTTQGFFTIRRSGKFWCGTWTDMTIEQSLMKNMKTSGGLTHGRGIGESVLTRWTVGMTSLQNVSENIEDFCGVSVNTSHKHVELRDSRIKRDNMDRFKMLKWLLQHFPFPETADLFSISTGIVADNRVDCHMSWELGKKSINRIVGNDFNTVKFKRSDRVQPLAIMTNVIQIENKLITINQTTLFQRMSIVKQSDEELMEYLTYDLGPYSLTLFDNGLMRKGNKSSLYKAFKPMTNIEFHGKCLNVIDGGFLLHKVAWQSDQSYSSICDNYVEYVKSKYQTNAIVIFDGYPEVTDGGTKCAERLRRSRKLISANILFDESMIPTVSKEKFLANPKNKNRLISMLITKFTSASIMCKQAKEDADTLIVDTALSLAQMYDSVFVVGEDVDLLVILIGLTKHDNVYFLKPGKCKVPTTLYSPLTAVDKEIAENILFLHAMSGCDSTSAFFNQGKIKFIQTIKRNPVLAATVKIFKNSDATHEMIADAGEQFLASLYCTSKGKKVPSLNMLRYKCYIKSAYKTNNNIAALPPSAAAARQHSLRVYYQVQQWLGIEKNPESWGWKKSKNGLMPITTLLPPAPTALLQQISCRCKTNCQRNCGCKKVGVYCSNICLNCERSCDNMEQFLEDGDDEVELSLIGDEVKQ